MDFALFLWIVGLALGFALLAGVFAIPTLLWWAIAGKSFTAGRPNPR